MHPCRAPPPSILEPSSSLPAPMPNNPESTNNPDREQAAAHSKAAAEAARMTPHRLGRSHIDRRLAGRSNRHNCPGLHRYNLGCRNLDCHIPDCRSTALGAQSVRPAANIRRLAAQSDTGYSAPIPAWAVQQDNTCHCRSPVPCWHWPGCRHAGRLGWLIHPEQESYGSRTGSPTEAGRFPKQAGSQNFAALFASD